MSTPRTVARAAVTACLAPGFVVRLCGREDLTGEVAATGGYQAHPLAAAEWALAETPTEAVATAAVTFTYRDKGDRVRGWRLEDRAGIVWRAVVLEEPFDPLRAGDAITVHVTLTLGLRT